MVLRVWIDRRVVWGWESSGRDLEARFQRTSDVPHEACRGTARGFHVSYMETRVTEAYTIGIAGCDDIRVATPGTRSGDQ